MGSTDKKKRIKKELKRFLLCTVAAVLFACNIKSFVNAGGLYPGGFAGVTLLIQNIAETFFGVQLPYTAVYLPLNIVPIYIGIRYLGKSFTAYSIYVIVLSSIVTDLLPSFPITYDVLLISIFGGIISGTAVGLSLYAGGSAGGTDFISLYFSQKKGKDTFSYTFAANVCILIIAGILFGFDAALYSIIFQFCNTQVIQALYKRYQQHTFLIVTDEPDPVYEKIKEITNHDATLFKGVGCYMGMEKNMLYSVVSSDEKDKVMAAIMETDPKAFVNVIKTERLGGWFYNRPHD